MLCMVFFLYLGFVNSRMGRCQKIRNRLLYRVWINVLKINLFEPWHRLEQELIHIPVEIWEGVTDYNERIGIGYVFMNPIREPCI